MVDSKKTELLFLALILRGLKKGGRAAVIVPDGVVFGSSKAHKKIRQELIEKHKLEAVISMPSGVFKPYAGVSTGILIFTKTTTGGTDKVWFYDMQADGYSLDDKRQPQGEEFDSFDDLEKLVNQHTQKEITYTDIPDVINRWRNRESQNSRLRTDKSFFVPVKDIIDNGYDLSMNRYKQVVYEEKTYDRPIEILNGKFNDKGELISAGIKQIDAERKKLLTELEKLLQ